MSEVEPRKDWSLQIQEKLDSVLEDAVRAIGYGTEQVHALITSSPLGEKIGRAFLLAISLLIATVAAPFLISSVTLIIGLLTENVRFIAFSGALLITTLTVFAFALYGSQEWINRFRKEAAQIGNSMLRKGTTVIMGAVSTAAGTIAGALVASIEIVVWGYTVLAENAANYVFPYEWTVSAPGWFNMSLDASLTIVPLGIGVAYDSVADKIASNNKEADRITRADRIRRTNKSKRPANTLGLINLKDGLRGVVQSFIILAIIPPILLFGSALFGGNDAFVSVRMLFEGPKEFALLLYRDIFAVDYQESLTSRLYHSMGAWTFIPVFLLLPLVGAITALKQRRKLKRQRRGEQLDNRPEFTRLSATVLLLFSMAILLIGFSAFVQEGLLLALVIFLIDALEWIRNSIERLATWIEQTFRRF